MRMSLLLQREPFGRIAADTLAAFWRERYRQSFIVTWQTGWPPVASKNSGPSQRWLCNIYLNAIFRPQATPAIFDPIRREFSHSLVAWRRPLQRAYVWAATSRGMAPWLAQAGLRVTPALPNATQTLIVGGNHKIRILDQPAGLAYGLNKAGFNPHFIRQEIAARRRAEALQLPVPALVETGPDNTWFCEQYVSGTPLNRLTDPAVVDQTTHTAVNALHRLVEHTVQAEVLTDYVTGLHHHIQTLIDRNHLLTSWQKQTLRRDTARLVERVSRQPAANQITTAVSHGDFQPGNILRNGDEVWLIDWEYTGRRQSGYDALVFTLHARFPRGLATRLNEFVAAGPTETALFKHWPGFFWQDIKHRRLYAALFLLEELRLHLEENDNPVFHRLGDGLQTMLLELSTYLEYAPTPHNTILYP